VPEAIVIAGANGAGKTTFARELLPALYPGIAFLNVDEVRAEGAPFVHPVAAGREVLRRLGESER
jgi:predicted ABC-type ATPase